MKPKQDMPKEKYDHFASPKLVARHFFYEEKYPEDPLLGLLYMGAVHG